MPQIEAFHGLRYDLGQVGVLSDLVAPPYDVIDGQMQDELYEKHPQNVVRLILNRVQTSDNQEDNRYTRAAHLLKTWRRDGVLQTEPQPAVYVYHQQFQHGASTLIRRGFMVRVRLERFGEGTIFPHEETHAAAKADRLQLISACRANLSQIFGLYPDPENHVQDVLEQSIVGVQPIEAIDHLNVVHRLWPVSDVSLITALAAQMSSKPMFIADGHHRYETACNYRDQLAHDSDLPSNHPANFVLAMCVGMSDPGMVVLPTHRLFRGIEPVDSQQLVTTLSGCFETRLLGQGPEQAAYVWKEIEQADRQTNLGFYAAADQQWVLASLTDHGQKQMELAAADHCTPWKNLGVSLLHRLVIEKLLGHRELPKPMYVHGIEEVERFLTHGDETGRDATGQQGTGENFPLACLVMPASIDHIQSVCEYGERMPAKSTYFYPKLLSGLVINPLH